MRFKECAIAGDPVAWEQAGFRVVADTVQIGPSLLIRLSGAGDGQVASVLLGSEAETRRRSFQVNGLTIDIEGLDEIPLSDPGTHPNSVFLGTKLALHAPDFEATVATLKSELNGLGTPEYEGKTDDGSPYISWDFDDMETGLNLFSVDSSQERAVWSNLMFTVEDLDESIRTIGQDKLTPKEDYHGREMVVFHAESGVTPGICLIAKDPDG